MKLKESNISSTFSGKNLDFTISETNKGIIFDVLMKKMYNDPIGTVVREIASNARDANREVGKAHIPIEIEISRLGVFSNNTPSLIIRDQGPGISDDRMEDTFSKFGESTKRHTNTLTGGFGLGAKSPFSYTNRFTIISSCEGKKKTYSAIVDSVNHGTIVFMGEEPTNETGVEIIIPLKTHDIKTFEEKAIYWTIGWDPRPNFIGFSISTEESFLDKKDIGNGLVLTSYNYDSHYREKLKFPIIMLDGIPYDVDFSNIFDPSGSDKEMYYALGDIYVWKKNKKSTVIMNFDVGELTMSAGRENIHFDDDTKKSIKERCYLLRDTLAKESIKYINETKSKSILDQAIANLYIRDVCPAADLALRWESNHKVIFNVSIKQRDELFTLMFPDTKYNSNKISLRQYYVHSNKRRSKNLIPYGQTSISIFKSNKTIYYSKIRKGPKPSIHQGLWESYSDDGFFCMFRADDTIINAMKDVGLNLIEYESLAEVKKVKIGKNSSITKKINAYKSDEYTFGEKISFIIKDKKINRVEDLRGRPVNIDYIIPLVFDNLEFRTNYTRQNDKEVKSILAGHQLSDKKVNCIMFRKKDWENNKKFIEKKYKVLDKEKYKKEINDKLKGIVPNWKAYNEIFNLAYQPKSDYYYHRTITLENVQDSISILYEILCKKAPKQSIDFIKNDFAELKKHINKIEDILIHHDDEAINLDDLNRHVKKILLDVRQTDNYKDIIYYETMMTDLSREYHVTDKVTNAKKIEHIRKYVNAVLK